MPEAELVSFESAVCVFTYMAADVMVLPEAVQDTLHKYAYYLFAASNKKKRA